MFENRPEVRLPRYLYKYLDTGSEFNIKIEGMAGLRNKNGFDALTEILNGEIFYSNIESFNDPFELKGVGFDGFETEDAIYKRAGYICLSGTCDNILMWSHYAGGHRGVCIELNCIEDAFYSDGEAGRVIKVDYDDERVSIGAYNNVDQILKKMSRKAKCWSYEEEYRVFNPSSGPKENDGWGIKVFNSRLINRIILGVSFPENDIERMFDVVKKSGLDVSVWKCGLSDETLSIEMTEIYS